MADETIVSWKVPPGPPALMGVFVRTPPLAVAAIARRVVREPVGSRLRTRMLGDSLRVGWELANRGEYDVLPRFYDPQCRINMGEGRPPDAPASIIGPQGLIDVFLRSDEALSAHFTVEEVLDIGGPCFAAHLERQMTGGISKLTVTDPLTCVYTMRDGVVAIQDLLYRRKEAVPALVAAKRAAA